MKRFNILILSLAFLFFAVNPAFSQTQDDEVVALTVTLNELVQLTLGENVYEIVPVLPLDNSWNAYSAVTIDGLFVVEAASAINVYTSIDRVPTDDSSAETLDVTDMFSLQMTGDFNASPVALTLAPELYVGFVGSGTPSGTYFLNMRSNPAWNPGSYTCNLTISAILE